VQGRVERVHDGVVHGWAWRPAEPRERVELRILINGEQVGTTAAELPRPSLIASGVGDGCHAFRFPLQLPVVDIPSLRLRVEADDGVPLPPANGFSVETSDDGQGWPSVRIGIDHPLARGFEPAVDGRVETIVGGELAGWAWLPAIPERRVVLRILLDGEEVGTTVADLESSKLEEAGIGDGRYAFRFQLPASHAHPGQCIVRVELDGDPLPAASALRSEGPLRSDDPWYGARLVIDAELRGEPSKTAATAAGGRASTYVRSDHPRGPAVLGEEGWLFDLGIARVGAGRERWEASVVAAVAALVDRLDQLDERLRAVGTRLLPVLVPAKEHVYEQLLPSSCRAAVKGLRPGDLLGQGLFDHPNLEPLDLLPALHAGANRLPVYSPDLPWLGEWGVYCAYRAMVKRIAAMIPTVKPPIEMAAGDVLSAPPRRSDREVVMLTTKGVVRVGADQLPLLPPEPVVVDPPGTPMPTPAEHLARLRAPLALGWEQPTRRELPRLLLVGGAADAALAQWVGRHFRYTLLVGGEVPLIDLVTLERPDVVAYMVDERLLGRDGK